MAGPDDIAIVRIELEGIEPLIWRRVAVGTSVNLTGMHYVIQAAMGWLNSHLWNFEVNGRKYGMRLPDEPDWNERIENATTTKLSSLLDGGARKFEYVYDMGDYWQHRIIVEKINAAEPGMRYPRFLGGERRCLPEDCGGIPGYRDFLNNISEQARRKAKGCAGLVRRAVRPR